MEVRFSAISDRDNNSGLLPISGDDALITVREFKNSSIEILRAVKNAMQARNFDCKVSAKIIFGHDPEATVRSMIFDYLNGKGCFPVRAKKQLATFLTKDKLGKEIKKEIIDGPDSKLQKDWKIFDDYKAITQSNGKGNSDDMLMSEYKDKKNKRIQAKNKQKIRKALKEKKCINSFGVHQTLSHASIPLEHLTNPNSQINEGIKTNVINIDSSNNANIHSEQIPLVILPPPKGYSLDKFGLMSPTKRILADSDETRKKQKTEMTELELAENLLEELPVMDRILMLNEMGTPEQTFIGEMSKTDNVDVNEFPTTPKPF